MSKASRITIMRWLRGLAAGVGLALMPLAVHAQSVVVPADALDAMIADAGLEGRIAQVNGPRTLHLGAEADMLHLGPASRLLVTLSALRLAERGLLDLDAPVKALYPGLHDRFLFEHWPTARQLMAETGGFAVPPYIGQTAKLDPYLQRSDPPGIWPREDVAGWALLVAILETAADKPFGDIMRDEVLVPLGLTVADWQAGDGPQTQLTVLAAKGSNRLVATLARLLTRNRDAAGGRYLSPELFDALTARLAWSTPLSPDGRTSGLMLRHSQGRRYLMSLPGCGVTFTAYPDADLTLIFKPAEPCTPAVDIGSLAMMVAASFVPPAPDVTFADPVLPARLQPVDGLFRARPEAPNPSLQVRFRQVLQPVLGLYAPVEGEGYLQIDADVRISIASRNGWRWETGDGQVLALDPAAPFDRFLLDGRVYERVAPTAEARYALWPLALILPVLISGIAFRRVRVHRGWRFTGTLSAVTLLLLGAGVAGEWFLWAPALYDWDMPWLVTCARIVLFTGLLAAMGLTLMMLALLKDPAPPRNLLTRFHLLVLGLAGLATVILAGVWGLASSFSAT